MTRFYGTFDAAQRRVAQLKTQGTWPGIIGPDADGRYTLTYDPGDTTEAAA